jgi:hypothetical protein
MKKTLCIAVCALLAIQLAAQNIFPQKIEGCNTSEFCLDCGDPKAGYDVQDFDKMISDLNATYHLKGVSGKLGFQVLVDSTGHPCVLSHTDKKKNKITLDAIARLNQCRWTPAMDHGKLVSSSVNVVFDISNGKLTGGIQRVDIQAMNENMSNPGTPDIYNKTYKYTNSSLNSYEITVWQKRNSGVPQDMSQHNRIDKHDTVWYATLNGMAKFDGRKFISLTESNSPFKVNDDANVIAVDRADNKWICANNDIYKYDNQQWIKCSQDQTGVKEGAYAIVPTSNGEVLFCTDDGLSILKDGKWTLLNTQTIKDLPSNKVYYAYRDKKDRLWIGTFSGSIMIDANQQVTAFNASATPLKGICISRVAEDEKGNLYFGAYAYAIKGVRDKPEEGLITLSADGSWKHYNDTNSGMPSNTTNSLMYDSLEKVLWIGTNESGLVRWDLKDGWETYHNGNSKVPSSYIFDMSQNSSGDIYVSTYNGMMLIHRKK